MMNPAAVDHTTAYEGPAPVQPRIIANVNCPSRPTPCVACVEQAIDYLAQARARILIAELDQ